MTVRTRIAPSPTGDPHVGTAYVALFNYCFAKQHGGQFLLRIEDTDQRRSTRESEQLILDALRWTGIEWDEGPDVGGPHGPYRQSERSALYAEHAALLLERGHAFRCFCTEDRLASMRAAQRAAGETMGYDGHCAHMSEDEVQAQLDAGVPHVVRMHVPRDGGSCVFRDRLRGDIEIPWREVDMQVLLKSDGMPTYHLANVVDDHHMQITHVMRGEEWISSAPKHQLLYEYFGWEMPELIHLPLLRNPDRSKLSKRKNPTSILYYQRLGVLPEALLNFLGLMGWSMPDTEEERFSLDEMVAAFDIDRMSLGGPIFDLDKLKSLNGRWIREALTVEQLGERVVDWALNEAYLLPIAGLIHKRISTLSELPQWVDHFFMEAPAISPDDLRQKQLDGPELLKALVFTQWRLERLRQWEAPAIEALLRETGDALEIKLRHYMRPLYVSMYGKPSGTPLFDSMAVLGPDLSRMRLRLAIEALGGLSGKAEKRLRREFDALLATIESSDDDGDDDEG